MELSLKTKNIPTIIVYLFCCTTLYILFLVGFTDFWNDYLALLQEMKKNWAVITLSPLLCFFLTGLLPSDFKEKLVFWRWSNPLPGSRAFTEIAPKDYRIDIKELEQKLGGFPQQPEDQNRRWYKLYRQVDNRSSVTTAHQRFLLARDLASISFLFLILTPWSIYFSNQGSIKELAIYVGILFVFYVISCLVAQNHANRFVCNVLVEHCSAKEEEKG